MNRSPKTFCKEHSLSTDRSGCRLKAWKDLLSHSFLPHRLLLLRTRETEQSFWLSREHVSRTSTKLEVQIHSFLPLFLSRQQHQSISSLALWCHQSITTWRDKDRLASRGSTYKSPTSKRMSPFQPLKSLPLTFHLHNRYKLNRLKMDMRQKPRATKVLFAKSKVLYHLLFLCLSQKTTVGSPFSLSR